VHDAAALAAIVVVSCLWLAPAVAITIAVRLTLREWGECRRWRKQYGE